MATAVETNTRKIVARLKRDGWLSQGGKRHEKPTHPDKPGKLVMVPRHRTVSDGVARGIARDAGWKD